MRKLIIGAAIVVIIIVVVIIVVVAIRSGLGYGRFANLPKWYVTGRVVDPSSSPLAETEIEAAASVSPNVLHHVLQRRPSGQWKNLETASDGKFAFTCEGHRLLVTFKHPGSIPKTFLFLQDARPSPDLVQHMIVCLNPKVPLPPPDSLDLRNGAHTYVDETVFDGWTKGFDVKKGELVASDSPNSSFQIQVRGDWLIFSFPKGCGGLGVPPLEPFLETGSWCENRYEAPETGYLQELKFPIPSLEGLSKQDYFFKCPGCYAQVRFGFPGWGGSVGSTNANRLDFRMGSWPSEDRFFAGDRG
jgi:hypothetical protein